MVIYLFSIASQELAINHQPTNDWSCDEPDKVIACTYYAMESYFQ